MHAVAAEAGGCGVHLDGAALQAPQAQARCAGVLLFVPPAMILTASCAKQSHQTPQPLLRTVHLSKGSELSAATIGTFAGPDAGAILSVVSWRHRKRSLDTECAQTDRCRANHACAGRGVQWRHPPAVVQRGLRGGGSAMHRLQPPCCKPQRLDGLRAGEGAATIAAMTALDRRQRSWTARVRAACVCTREGMVR